MKNPYKGNEKAIADEILNILVENKDELIETFYDFHDNRDFIIDTIAPAAAGVYQGNYLWDAFDFTAKDAGITLAEAKEAGYNSVSEYVEAIENNDVALDPETTYWIADDASRIIEPLNDYLSKTAKLPGRVYIGWMPEWGDLGLIYTLPYDEWAEWALD